MAYALANQAKCLLTPSNSFSTSSRASPAISSVSKVSCTNTCKISHDYLHSFHCRRQNPLTISNRRRTSSSSRSNLTCTAVDSSQRVFQGDLDNGGSNRRWERVMLKVSGEALAGEQGFGINNKVVQAVAREVAVAALSGIQVAIVVGGGNFFRGAEFEGEGLDRASADYMGMLATVMNSLSLQAALEKMSVPTRVLTAIEIKEVAEPFIRRRAIRHLEKGRVVIFGAGTGNPFFTTDTAAALRAAEVNCQAFLKATKVDGVYDKDPAKHADAKFRPDLTYDEVIEEDLNVMDATAITLCRENKLPIVVFNMNHEGSITQALRGDPIGSQIML